ncbi:trypsin CFT-1-like [Anticarsia gemmatalis]|uniref:trypsin CFT-1-like n=1 Tax=Anticarsia gemmatalis TaxID=129554 RepID=UPI003F764245
MVALLFSAMQISYFQFCGGIILNQRSVLSAAHCFDDDRDHTVMWRMRVGSTLAHSGGVVHNTAQIIIHEQFNSSSMDSDLAILRSASAISYGSGVQPARIGAYYVEGNQVVWASGWGVTVSIYCIIVCAEYSLFLTHYCPTASSIEYCYLCKNKFNLIQQEQFLFAEELRHVQVYSISQDICRQRYGESRITDNMLCSGVLDVGGRDQCSGDSGGPLYHNGVVVGVCSWGPGTLPTCGNPHFPGVNVRVSSFILWIQNNA